MARLHEYQGKSLLKQHGIAVPRGEVIRTSQQAREVAQRLFDDGADRVILKVQAWITGRKSKGGVVFASTADEAASAATKLLSMKFGNFPVTEVLVEQTVDIQNELFVSLSIDDAARAPVLLVDCQGGSGIEDRAATVARLPIDVKSGINLSQLRGVLKQSSIASQFHDGIAQAVDGIVRIAKQYEARSVEVNPLVTTKNDGVVAADCRMTIDDYAVFRHPELGIDIARELDHPPTPLERIAYQVEQSDHRGTFYFAQLPTDGAEKSRGVIGFHGAGGGGSMMSMDAVSSAGFTLANFCDTSGNPSASKVYRAARIILAQPGLVGYFGSGSGVASQEQFWSAYGIAKAFIELGLTIPAVIRLGGNSEDRAVEILNDACKNLSGRVEGYRKDDTPAACAKRFAELIEKNLGVKWTPKPRALPKFVGSGMSIAITGGRVWLDTDSCDAATTALVARHSSGLLKDDNGKPALALSEAKIAGKDSELIACEIECHRAGKPVMFVDLPIPGLDDASQHH